MKKLMLSMFLATGCSLMGAGAPPASQSDCSHYDDLYLGWTSTAAVAGGLAGTGGVIVPIIDGNDDAVMGVGIATAVLGALAAASGLIANLYAERYAEHGCGVIIEPAPPPDPVPVLEEPLTAEDPATIP